MVECTTKRNRRRTARWIGVVVLLLGSSAYAEPEYQTIVEEEYVLMDDGVEIATSIGRPCLDGMTPAPGEPRLFVQRF